MGALEGKIGFLIKKRDLQDSKVERGTDKVRKKKQLRMSFRGVQTLFLYNKAS